MQPRSAEESILEGLIEDVALEIVFEVHRKLVSGRLCVACDSLTTEVCVHEGKDIFGQSVSLNPPAELFGCTNCGQRIASARFAPHLEKCMGRGGRPSRARQAAVIATSLMAGGDSDDAREADYRPAGEKKRRTE